MSDYHARLPIGQRVATKALTGDDLWPFDVDLETVPLEAPRIPEPARHGLGGVDCRNCQPGGALEAWRSDRWQVRIPPRPSGLPMVAVLITREHHELETMSPELAAELGPMMQRVARAISRLPDVGRVHVNRWGDGSEHFHIWFLARPLGMWQLRGAMLAVWDDLLPKLPQEEWDRNRVAVATALAEDGGESLLSPDRLPGDAGG